MFRVCGDDVLKWFKQLRLGGRSRQGKSALYELKPPLNQFPLCLVQDLTLQGWEERQYH